MKILHKSSRMSCAGSLYNTIVSPPEIVLTSIAVSISTTSNRQILRILALARHMEVIFVITEIYHKRSGSIEEATTSDCGARAVSTD
jgi:hypothetical protein